MIIDFNTGEVPSIETDLCIIGGGIAAYTILSSLAQSSMRILVIERGGLKPGTNETNDKACKVTGHPFTGHQEGRYFGLGGTSEYWGGQALPLNDFDFYRKEWVEFSGWPIDIHDIAPYFLDAEKLMQVDPVSYDADVFALRALPPLKQDPSKINFHFSKWSPSPNFKPKLIHAYGDHPRITILTNGLVTSMAYDEETKSVRSVDFQNAKGKKGKVKAKNFVLASGGLENARLLLASYTLPKNEWIGKMFQDHPTAQVATIRPGDMTRFQQYFNYFFKGKTRCMPRLSLTYEAVQHHRILSATAFVQFIPAEGSIFESIKEIYRPITRAKLPSLRVISKAILSLRKFGSIFPILKAYWVDHFAFVPDSTPRLTLMIEQSPSAESYIALSDTLDINGQCMPEIHWKIPEATSNTLKVFCSILESEFVRLDLGTIDWDPWVKEDNESIKAHLIDAYHHMGTTRMSTSSTTGVVDENCCIHGINNVYVSGSSVFPTSGHSNPTLTCMALALKLSQYLESKFQP